MTALVLNTLPSSWSGETKDDGHREFLVTHKIVAAKTDGPFEVMNAAGLPLPGAVWSFRNDLDFWAFCTPYIKVRVSPDTKPGNPSVHWLADQKFSTKPTERCRDQRVEDPLMEPQRLSGTFTNHLKEVVQNNDATPVQTTAFEMLRGGQVEFDHAKPTVEVGQNVLSLGLGTLAQMINTVNDDGLWGLSARMVKLSRISWTRKLYGTCNYYFTRNLGFDIDQTTFDREVINEGHKILSGHWDAVSGAWVLDGSPNPSNPDHYEIFQDRKGNTGTVILNANGTPWNGSGDPPTVTVYPHSESDFTTLGIPTTF
jgi:hypothetical protein